MGRASIALWVLGILVGLCVIAMVGYALFGGPSREQIGETVKTSMQTKFDSDSQFKDWRLTVTSVQVFKQGNNQYQGLAKITYEGTSYGVPVEITVDGKRWEYNVLWKTDPGAFLFITQKELEKLKSPFDNQ